MPAASLRLHFEPDHEEFRTGVRRFFQQEIAPHVERWREQGHVDRSAFTQAGALGYLLTWAGEQYGGAGIDDLRYEQILVEECVRHADVGIYFNLHSTVVAPYIAEIGNEEQRQRFLPKAISGEHILAIAMTEPGAGSDLAGMRTQAKPTADGSGWVLNGAKTYISNGTQADVVVVAARTSTESKHAIGLFVVEAGMPGFTRGRKLKKMGLPAQDTAELFFDHVVVPAANVLGDPTQGFAHMARLLAKERLSLAMTSLAHAQTAFDLTLDYIKERQAFGQAIGAFQNSRFVMAGLRAELDATQCFVDQCVLLANAGRLDADTGAKAKLLATDLEGKVIDACLQLHGGAGYMDEYRISRMYTDARVSRIFAGSNEIMKEIIGRGLGLYGRRR
ncbi:acyl-CoA dehydrogenase family protein [Ideonella livida]|uniref:Acyl-CoA dehydrogenase n=1 Tax=Ideonella livida TaxID=2707176 RepID=A0A7C9PHK5_9BURK|nr:acyl-CoA dehydrogenase family protein [Ideonella livida]NDY91234.1 acyl-CoA dehydrogenase [Ideonella livida]